MPRIKLGQKVKVVSASHGWGAVREGMIGTVVGVNEWSCTYRIDFPGVTSSWGAEEHDLVGLPQTPERRTAKKLQPKDNRETVAVKLIKKITKGDGKFTAVKVESEGRLNRTDRCTDDCSMRTSRIPHLDCQYFSDVKVANDFILKHLSRYGLAKRCKPGENPWGHFYTVRKPLVFSKVYTDSETEWTTTLLLKNAEDVLYTPMLVDAFNALATANGGGINVSSSGMHTAFLQGIDGIYPSSTTDKTQPKKFNNFSKSMKPLLPALYLLGANRIEDGVGVTRSFSYRQPMISANEKYSAIAYRYGAVEFRVFDTCYEHRDQILDNIVVMAQSIDKYWHAKYVKPNVDIDKPVYFGGHSGINNTNSLEGLYVVKEHIVLLNKGLRCIKPPYLTVKEIKKARNFSLTVRGIKSTLDISAARKAYNEHLKSVEAAQIIQSAREYYTMVERIAYQPPKDLKKTIRNFRAKANRKAKKIYTADPIECIAYKTQFGTGYSLGEY